MMSFGVKFLAVCLPLAIILTNTPTTSGLQCYVGICGTFDIPNIKKCGDNSFKKVNCTYSIPPGNRAVCIRAFAKGTDRGKSGETTTVNCGFSEEKKDECTDTTDKANKALKEGKVEDATVSKSVFCICSKDFCNSKDSLRASGVAAIVIVATIVFLLALQ